MGGNALENSLLEYWNVCVSVRHRASHPVKCMISIANLSFKNVFSSFKFLLSL